LFVVVAEKQTDCVEEILAALSYSDVATAMILNTGKGLNDMGQYDA
jgi:hypothetical protein